MNDRRWYEWAAILIPVVLLILAALGSATAMFVVSSAGLISLLVLRRNRAQHGTIATACACVVAALVVWALQAR